MGKTRRFRLDIGNGKGIWDMVYRLRKHRDIGKDNIYQVMIDR